MDKNPRSEIINEIKKKTLKEGSEEAPPPWGRSTGRSEFAAEDESKRGPRNLLPPRVPPPGLKLNTVCSACIPCNQKFSSNQEALQQQSKKSISKKYI